MKISKEKFAALKQRARKAGGRAVSGTKGSAVQALSGVVAYFAHSTAAQKVGFVGNNWWSGPAILAVGGHLLKKKAKTANIGSALLGAAGYAGAMGYQISKGAPKTETKGLLSPEDVRGLITPADPYALPDSEAVTFDDEADVSSAMALG